MSTSVQDKHEVAGHISQYAGKYLTFNLGKETFALRILTVQEIIGMMTISKVPRTPSYVRGITNLRGRVIPVIDLRTKFGMDCVEDTEKTVIIVVQLESGESKITAGIVVDEVSEVVDIETAELEPRPDIGSGNSYDFIMAMGKIKNQVVMLLDVNRVLSDTELSEVAEI